MKSAISLFVFIITIFCFFSFNKKNEPAKQWIRINQLGYTPAGVKVAVWCGKEEVTIPSFDVIDSAS
ncbi:MAG TPA: cellulase N-terminal Ig-like domain-containing protein, partial [Hanamia sp.]